MLVIGLCFYFTAYTTICHSTTSCEQLVDIAVHVSIQYFLP
jgi:hypothetical protein